jgi:hypothetical protein
MLTTLREVYIVFKLSDVKEQVKRAKIELAKEGGRNGVALACLTDYEGRFNMRTSACFSYYAADSMLAGVQPFLWVGVYRDRLHEMELKGMPWLPKTEVMHEVYGNWLVNASPYKDAYLSQHKIGGLVRMDVSQDTYLIHQASTMLRMPVEHPRYLLHWYNLVLGGLPPTAACVVANLLMISRGKLQPSFETCHAAISNVSLRMIKVMMGSVPEKSRGSAWSEVRNYVGHGSMWDAKTKTDGREVLTKVVDWEEGERVDCFGDKEAFAHLPVSIESYELIARAVTKYLSEVEL